MTPEQAIQNIQAALDSNNFTAPKTVHVQLQQCIEILKQALQPKKDEDPEKA